MYDRTALRAAALEAGDENSNQLAIRLGLPRNTAWRLWHGKVAPSPALAAAVQEAYGLPVAELIKRAPAA